MFCPTCGKENTGTRKFCFSCGTNLEVVSQALSGHELSWFTRLDMELDHELARYAAHVFDDAPAQAGVRKVANSWKILGKGIITSFVDLFLSIILWVAFVVRFDILLLSTPFRLLLEHSRKRKLKQTSATEEQLLQALPEAPPQTRLPGPVPSITEYTTENLQEYRRKSGGRSETDAPH
jgi:hypothetical protein